MGVPKPRSGRIGANSVCHDTGGRKIERHFGLQQKAKGMNSVAGKGSRWSRKSRVWLPCAMGLCVFFLLAGCGSRRAEDDGADASWLAVVGDVPITAEAFHFEVQRRLETGQPLGEPASILADLVEREAMLQRARASEALMDPVVQREIENQILVKWLDQELHRQRDAVQVGDDELEAYYKAHAASFRQPELVRLAILYRRFTPNDPEETQQSLAEALATARARFLEDPAAATREGRMQGFGILAAEHSEHTVSRYRGGDLGWLDPEQARHRVSPNVLSAGLALDPGVVSEVIVSDDGLYVVMKTGFQPARVQPLEDVAAGLRRRLIRERQEAIEAQFREQLLEQAKVTVYTERLARLPVSPAGESSAAMTPPDAGHLPLWEGEFP